MNKALFDRNVKSNAALFLVIILILGVYTFMVNYMYEPALAKLLADYQDSMPKVMGAFGMVGNPSDLVRFLGVYLYGFILVIFPLIFSIILANRLIVNYIDKGSMDYLISTDMSRFKIVFTQAVYMIFCLFLLVMCVTLVEIATSTVFFYGKLDIISLLSMNLGLFCLHIFFGALCFFGSCFFSELTSSTTFGAGLSIIFIILSMVAGANDSLKGLEKYTPVGLFDVEGLISLDQSAFMAIGILAIAGIILYLLAMLVFCKRDINV